MTSDRKGGAGPRTQPHIHSPVPSRVELAELAMTGTFWPEMALEQLFDRIEGGRA